MRHLLLVPLLLAAASTAHASEYVIDTSHSALIWGVQHVGLGNTYGRFNDFSGTITFDSEDLASSGAEVTVQMDSVDSHSKKRDAHLRNADFFDAGTHPTMTFSGTGFEAVEGEADTYRITGELTLRGETREITVTLRKTGQGQHPMAKKPAIGFEGEFTLPFKEFGVGQGDAAKFVGDTARVIIALEGIVE